MNNPFFSIVTISYNQSPFVSQTIQSVLNQTFTDFEYIIQDPGSTDGSQEIIKSFTDKRISSYFESDDGAADGLNRGFSKAKGKYYLYLNSDDMLLPTALEYIHHYLIKNSDCDVLCGAGSSIDSDGNHIRYIYPDKPIQFMMAYGASIIIQPSTAIKSSCFSRINGFNPQNKVCWDGELYVDLFMSGAKFKITSRVLSQYRLHSDSITCSDKLAHLRTEWANRRYVKVTRKPISQKSRIVGLISRFLRKALNPRDTLQRIFNGSQSGRFSNV